MGVAAVSAALVAPVLIVATPQRRRSRNNPQTGRAGAGAP